LQMSAPAVYYPSSDRGVSQNFEGWSAARWSASCANCAAGS
jgi:hypothetical protein